MFKKITKEEFINHARNVHGDKYDYSKVDLDNRDEKGRVCIICPKHGEFWQLPNSHTNGHGCKKCYTESMKKRAFDTETFIKKAREIHGDKYDYSKSVYKKSATKLIVICPEHGEFSVIANNHLRGSGCPKCAGRNKTNSELIETFRKIHGSKYDYSKVEYINSETKVCVICPEHGEFWTTPYNHYKGKGCAKCAKEHLRMKFSSNKDEFIEQTKQVHGDKYIYDNVNYINANTVVEVICPKHGSFYPRPSDHIRGGNCPVCAFGNASQSEKDLLNYIETIIPKEEISSKNRDILDSHEIDILLPKYNIGIEYNGLYWHSEIRGKDKNYHLDKTNLAKSKGVHLIHIFEDEWLEHKDIVKDKIRHILNKDTNKIKIGGRKCQIREISSSDSRQFLDSYHIQGFVPSTIYCGAFYQNNLVGVMCFLKESEGKWNLTRFATNFNYSIPGLANKLFTYFTRMYDKEIKEVKTFLDRRWAYSDTNVYDKMNFKLEGIIKPSYYYVKNQKRYHKFNFRKQILHKKYGLPLNMSEKEMTIELGYYRIWDCGLFKYVWRK